MSPSAIASVPADRRLYAIGDIHGCLGLLQKLLKQIEADAEKYPDKAKTLIFLGDYIDRGLDSRGVIELLAHGLPQGFQGIFLRGNHEDVLLRFLAGDDGVLAGWLTFGGHATAASYGVNSFAKKNGEDAAKLRELLTEKIPVTHLTFMQKTQVSHSNGDYFFAHAGARFDVPLEQQSQHDLMWIRSEFLESQEKHEKVIVHGHTISDEPEFLHNRIGIDTGAYASGRLTCLILDGTNQSFLST